jgi:hypothetical protein
MERARGRSSPVMAPSFPLLLHPPFSLLFSCVRSSSAFPYSHFLLGHIFWVWALGVLFPDPGQPSAFSKPHI